MRKSTLIILTILFALLSQSCLRFHGGLRKTDRLELKPKVFPVNFKKALYKTNIRFFNKDYSGLMFFKHNAIKKEVRFVFLSEFGLKFFDFKLTDAGVFTVEYIIDELNRKSLISVLEQDFRLLFQRGIVGNETVFEAKRKGFNVQRIRQKKQRYYYFINQENQEVAKIELTGSIFKKVKIILSDFNNQIAKEISIKHLGMSLSLNLKLVE